MNFWKLELNNELPNETSIINEDSIIQRNSIYSINHDLINTSLSFYESKSILF